MKLNVNTVKILDFILTTNPLLLRNEKGDYEYFLRGSLVECYLSFIKYFKAKYPRGYFEIPLFLCDYFDMKLKDAERLNATWRVERFLNGYKINDPIFFDWNDQGEVKNVLYFLLIHMSDYIGSKFSKGHFDEALRTFYTNFTEHEKDD